MQEEEFAEYGGVLQIGVPPLRIDIISKVVGLTFDEAISANDAFELEGRKIPVIGVKALIKIKQAAGRKQDLADAETLLRMHKTNS